MSKRARKQRTPRRPWTWVEEEMMRLFYADTLSTLLGQALERPVGQVYAKAWSMGLAKSPEFQASDASGRLVRGSALGMRTRFQKGNVSWNKGTHYEAGGRSAETRFKPGERGNKFVPIGTERLNSDGYLDRKVAATGKCNVDWKAVHRLVWEEAHGPVPSGHVVAFKDGDKRNPTLANLVLRTRQEHMSHSTIANYPPELRQLVRLVAKVQRKLDDRTQ